MELKNKNVLLTGASQGIGKTLKNILKECNVNLICTYNNTLINDSNIDSIKCDISNEEDINNLFNYIKNKYGHLDILINCAAISLDNDLYAKSKEEFMKVLEVNLVGTFLMCKYASLVMDNGIIINVSSTDAVDTFNSYGMDYASSKAGIDNLTKNLALRLPNLKILAISPNYVDTESTLTMENNFLNSELKRIGQKELLKKEDVAKKIMEMINNETLKSGDIVRMSGMDEN